MAECEELGTLKMLTLELSGDPTISLFSYLSKRNKNVCLDKAYIQLLISTLSPIAKKQKQPISLSTYECEEK